MTPQHTVGVERRGTVAVVTLDRPDQLNALNPAMLTELLAAIDAVRTDATVNALVVTGRGRLFSAGVDLSTSFFMEGVEDPSIYAGKRLLDWQHELILALHELPIPTLAALNGHACGGGGLGIAMACDLRFAVAGARMWLVPGALDVVQDFGLSWLLQRVIGPSRAMHLALTGHQVSAEEALAWGMVNEVHSDLSTLEAAVDGFVERLSTMGGDAVRMLKTVLRVGVRSTLREQLQVEAIANGLAFQSAEFQQKKADYLATLRGRR